MTDILTQLINDGAPSRAVEIKLGSIAASAIDTWSYQDQHDNFNTNATIQVSDIDVSSENPVPTTISSILPTTVVASLAKEADKAATDSDVGIAMLAVRDDALATLTPADGDYTQLRVTSTGQLHVSDSTLSSAVHNEDAAHSNGDAGIQALAVRNDTLGALAGANKDYTPLQVSAAGALYANPSKVRTTVEVFNGTVANSAEMGKTEIAIPTEVEAMHLWFNSSDTTATFTFTMRMESSGDDYSSTLLDDITLTSSNEAHLVSSLNGVPYLVVNYSNSSGSSNTLVINAIYEEYQ